MPIDVIQEHDGIAEVVIDHPPVNALDVAGWFELADALIAVGRVPTNRVAVLRATGRGFCAGVDIKEINAKGDEALVGREPGLRRRLRRRLRLRGPGHRRRAGLLPRRRHRAGRQRRHGHRLRGRHLRAARGRPRRARRRHPPGPAGPPARHAQNGLHGQAHHRRRAGVLRLGRRRGAAGPPAGGRARAGRRHRHQEPDHHPPGQGVAQRHRPRRREAQLPLRAGLHLRAARPRRGRRAAGRLRREARRRHLHVER